MPMGEGSDSGLESDLLIADALIKDELGTEIVMGNI